MPPNDQPPRYQLIDPSTGDVVGSLFGDGEGNVVIADETDTQTQFTTDGIDTPAVNAASVSANSLNNADLENADADTVPTAQGDGTLAMERAGGDGYVQRGPTTFDITLEP